jgi:hypothetical protein
MNHAQEKMVKEVNQGRKRLIPMVIREWLTHGGVKSC